MVERLRSSDIFVPELSLIAEVNNQVVGYILLTKINIVDTDNNINTSLAVLQKFQGNCIGTKLIESAQRG